MAFFDKLFGKKFEKKDNLQPIYYLRVGKYRLGLIHSEQLKVIYWNHKKYPLSPFNRNQISQELLDVDGLKK